MSTTITSEVALQRLTKDLKTAAATLTPNEARYLVDAYYQIQDYRKAAHNQVVALSKSGEPHDVIAWLELQQTTLEDQIRRALDVWGDASPLGKWAKSITGIGPVISAGLLAYIDITKAPTVGHIWSFAGYNPESKWEKGQKRPWSAGLKVLAWKIGESFVKVQNLESDVYGKVYKERRAFEDANNDAGKLAAQASAKLERFKIGKTTDAYAAYSSGKLPPAHLHARAKRYAVKLFLAHYHEVAYRLHYGTAPPKPYAIEHLGHAHLIPPPNAPTGEK